MTEAPEDDEAGKTTEMQAEIQQRVEFLKKSGLFSRHYPDPKVLLMDPKGEEADLLRELLPKDRFDKLTFIDPKGDGSGLPDSETLIASGNPKQGRFDRESENEE